MSEEIWKEVVGCDKYEVSSAGRIRRSKPAKGTVVGLVRTPQIGKEGYARIMYRGLPTNLVHRIVANAFLGDISGKDINHINGNKSDNRIENLEICSRSHNMKHAIHCLGTRISKLTVDSVLEIRKLSSYGLSYGEIAKAFDVTATNVWSVVKRKSWAHV
jgi:hypothetical protein